MKLAVALIALTAACGGPKTGPIAHEVPPEVPLAQISHGITATLSSQSHATLWVRTNKESTVTFVVTATDEPTKTLTAHTRARNDYTATVTVTPLAPATSYRYEVRTSRAGSISEPTVGQFKTPPPSDDSRPVRFAWSGDLAGQNVCRDRDRGFPIVDVIVDDKPDFFIALGDMVYADGICKATGAFGNPQVAGEFGVAKTLEDFWAHWRYNRADVRLQALLSSRFSFAVWDDHEVVNDFGRDHELRSTGEQAFRTYNPFGIDAPLYRSLPWGKHLELIFLDNRTFRDSNSARDDGPVVKTMLGHEQKRWLKERLSGGPTWKVIVSSVPISIPTGEEDARDGWADHGSGLGFERELQEILEAAKADGGADVLWITTDVHFASVFRYSVPNSVPNNKTPYTFVEAVAGPMSAGLFPTREFDKTFGTEQLFFHGPDDPQAAAKLSFEESLAYMTFGSVHVGSDGTLILKIINANGKTLFETELKPRAGL